MCILYYMALLFIPAVIATYVSPTVSGHKVPISYCYGPPGILVMPLNSSYRWGRVLGHDVGGTSPHHVVIMGCAIAPVPGYSVACTGVCHRNPDQLVNRLLDIYTYRMAGETQTLSPLQHPFIVMQSIRNNINLTQQRCEWWKPDEKENPFWVPAITTHSKYLHSLSGTPFIIRDDANN